VWEQGDLKARKKSKNFSATEKVNKTWRVSSLSADRICGYIVGNTCTMPKRDKNEVKTDWFKFRCATSFKERLEAAAKRESRTMSNLIVLIMTKYCEQQEALLSKTPPLYMHPKTKPKKGKGNPGRYENEESGEPSKAS